MTHRNLFATLKYAVEVSFFRWQNIPLNYFTKSLLRGSKILPDEAEPQFTKVIRIVGEARRIIQDFNMAQLTKYLKQVYSTSKNRYQLQGKLGRLSKE